MTLKNGGGERRKSSHENSAWRQGDREAKDRANMFSLSCIK